MEKIFVEVKCPALSESFEFRISKKLSVSEGKEKIINEIRCFAGNDKLFENDVSLFCGEYILNGSLTFAENGVKSGDIIMIV